VEVVWFIRQDGSMGIGDVKVRWSRDLPSESLDGAKSMG
jgi:hypothetical protein